MCSRNKLFFGLLLTVSFLWACGNNKDADQEKGKSITLKGLYSFGPEVKSFTDCDEGREYWVADSAKNLELQYANLGFEKPYTPVYIEVEAHLVKSDTSTVTGGYDSTMVVTKVLKVLKDIPEGPCNQ
ncbi:lipoprotein involved with copper homeostasis and adhesion [compost metagenome]